MDNLTYISLFSGAGIGCHGFKLENFKCVATAEIIEKRLNIQKYNKKCIYDSGYITGDLTKNETKQRIKSEINLWEKNHDLKSIDVLISTPPCQGISVANHKKKNELKRNSLVVESIGLVVDIKPKIFVFENVRGFLNTICTDKDGNDKSIRDAIELNLGGLYNIHYQVFNFKDYGSPSSRTRTLVLGVRKDLQELTPLGFMPDLQPEKTIGSTIGNLQPLKKMGEISSNDIYHNFRPYAKHMIPWVEDIKEGGSAFDNQDLKKRPHQIMSGEIVFNTNKNGDKYSRCFWDKPGPCIHTRNDILASQSTIHPKDNRVFSIRELMRLMSIPSSFEWSNIPEDKLNKLSLEEKQRFLKKEELNIRQSIGEAVPTVIFQQIARKIKSALKIQTMEEKDIERIININKLDDLLNLKNFLNENLNNYSFSELSKIAELANSARLKHAAYYTRQDICFTLIKDLPDASVYTSLSILEPSAGVGNFLPLLIEKYKTVPNVQIDVIDIDKNAVEVLKILLKKINVPENIKINYLIEDFLLFGEVGLFAQDIVHYDIVVGNPPFGKITDDEKLLAQYKKGKFNTKTSNAFSFFLEKAINHGDTVALIIPKSFLSAPEFNDTRDFVSRYVLSKITDYGEKAFKGVKIETISLIVNTRKDGVDNKVLVESYVKNETWLKRQNYICSDKFPYWVVYRDSFFDNIAEKLKFGVFTAYRDRQITKKITRLEGNMRILKSRNIGNNEIIDIPSYDSYVDIYDNLSIVKYLNHDEAVLVPNLTYYPRACFLPENTLVDGSVAVLVPKDDNIQITEKDLAYFSTDEFVEFYKVARNFGTRSLNIDNNSVFFFGVKR